MRDDSALHPKPTQNKVTIFFCYSAYGWLACTAVFLLCSSGCRFDALLGAAILVLFVDLPIIFPVGVSVGLLAVLASWFLNCDGKSNFRRYSTAIALCELAGIIMLPAWSSVLELIAEGAPPAIIAKSAFLQKIKDEQTEERAQVDHYVQSRPSVRPGQCMFGPDFWATGPDDIRYIKLLMSLKQLHSIQRCIYGSEVPLVVFPTTVLFALWGMDRRRRISKTATGRGA